MKHTRVVVLDLAPGDVLVLRTDDPFDIEDVRILCAKFNDLFKIKTLIIDSSVDMERFSQKRITAIRAMFSDPRFRASMEKVSSVVNQITPAIKPHLARRCGMPTAFGDWHTCGKPLDSLDRCPEHGNAWSINAAAIKRETGE